MNDQLTYLVIGVLLAVIGYLVKHIVLDFQRRLQSTEKKIEGVEDTLMMVDRRVSQLEKNK